MDVALLFCPLFVVLSFFFTWLVLLLLCLFVLYVILALRSPAFQLQLSALLFACILSSFCFCCSWLFCLVNQSRSNGEAFSAANWFKPAPPQ